MSGPTAAEDELVTSEAQGQLYRRLERALRGDERAAQRLTSAGTSVVFLVAGDPEESVTLLLDRRPVELVSGCQPAEITIELTTEQVRGFVDGDLVLPIAIWEGEVRCRGPVRKYLTVDPIVRTMLVATRGDREAPDR